MPGGGDEYWWATLDILAGREEKRTRKDILADVDEWLMRITAKINKQRRLALEQPATAKGKEEELAADVGVESTAREVGLKLLTKQSKVDVAAVNSEEGPVEYTYYESALGDQVEIECTFKDPRIRSRLERLMGSNVVRIMDRKYMTKLQERLKEDHVENLTRRIQEREAEEVEREKKLILEGKIPIEEAPKELKDHPVCKINQITKNILGDKKPKGKSQSKLGHKTIVKKPKESPEKAKPDEQLIKTAEDEKMLEQSETLHQETLECDELHECPSKEEQPQQDVKMDNLIGKEEYDKLKYEDPLVKVMKEAEDVEEMYSLAEKIVGPLKHTRKSKI